MPTLDDILAGYPEASPSDAERVRRALKTQGDVFFVVLDDDPTGTQSVHSLPVLTSWRAQDIAWAMGTGAPAVYIMTNSRSLPPTDAVRINREVVRASYEALASSPGKRLIFVSRSDSTLRGHYPLEVDTLAAAIKEYSPDHHEIDGNVILPAFPEAGRITVGGLHYARLAEGTYVQAAQSEFARDATFGYRHSMLSEWVEEKSRGTIHSSDVSRIDLRDLREGNPEVLRTLLNAAENAPIAVDCACESDMQAFTLALIEAENAGKHFIYRVGPPYMRARIGQDVAEPVSDEALGILLDAQDATPGGLIIIGSHVDLTTRQLATLTRLNHPYEIELDVSRVLGGEVKAYLREIAQEITTALSTGNVVLQTSRTLVRGSDEDDSLRIARDVSGALVSVVQQVTAEVRPRFVVAKGGITSSDMATRGLCIGRANVVGSMLPGIVSLWQASDGTLPGLAYIVFAGNVGSENSLAEVVDRLSHHTTRQQ